MSLSASPDDFRRHVLYGAAEGVRPLLVALPRQLLAEPEVGQDYVAVLVDEDVLQFDVPVDDPQLRENFEDEFLSEKSNVARIPEPTARYIWNSLILFGYRRSISMQFPCP